MFMPRGGPRPNSGGARPGAGRPPTDLRRVIAQRDTPGGTVDVSVMDRVEETIRNGGFEKDAAARVGVSVETLRRWVKTGIRLRIALQDAKQTLADSTRHERDCLELAHRIEVAEAEARTALMALGNKLARGNYTRTETVTKRDANGNVLEVTEKTSVADPDGGMVRWILQHRWPEDYARSRLELTGADGGPMVLEAEPIADKLRGLLAEAGKNAAAGSREAVEARLAEAAAASGTNGHGTNGNGSAP
jgi:hypothetical protein